MLHLGIESHEGWKPEGEEEGLTTFYFICGCDMTLQDDGELADTLHTMCDAHLKGHLDS